MDKFNAGKYFPPGHFYSPIVDLDFAKKYEHTLWPPTPDDAHLGFDFNSAAQQDLLRTKFAEFMVDFDYPSERKDGAIEFYQSNGMFSGLDAWRSLLCCVLTDLSE